MSMTDQKSINLNGVRALALGQTIWDSKVKGFVARRQKGSGVSYIVFYRTKEGRQRWYTIGRHGSPWTPDLAHKEALRILLEVAGGGDPAAEKSTMRKGATVADLCDQYLQDAGSGRLLMRRGASKKASTLVTDKSRIDNHIKPILGALKVAAVRREDVERFMHAVAEGTKAAKKHIGRGGASRTMGLLGAIFTYAVRKRLRSDNPAHGIVRFKPFIRAAPRMRLIRMASNARSAKFRCVAHAQTDRRSIEWRNFRVVTRIAIRAARVRVEFCVIAQAFLLIQIWSCGDARRRAMFPANIAISKPGTRCGACRWFSIPCRAL
jgi:Arm DNA-binding domain/Phage integrase, N-terminal SAM-like domain